MRKKENALKELKKIYSKFTLSDMSEYLEINPNTPNSWKWKIPTKYHRRLIEHSEWAIDDLVQFINEYLDINKR